MPSEPDGEKAPLVRSLRLMQENLRNSGPAVLSGYTLISAILIFGGIGFALDRWLTSSPWFLLAGLLIGIVVGFVELARIVFRQK
jgi:F0F1-type ATP synthase assembly protein I